MILSCSCILFKLLVANLAKKDFGVYSFFGQNRLYQNIKYTVYYRILMTDTVQVIHFAFIYNTTNFSIISTTIAKPTACMYANN